MSNLDLVYRGLHMPKELWADDPFGSFIPTVEMVGCSDRRWYVVQRNSVR